MQMKRFFFPKVFDRDKSQRDLNNDLCVIIEWVFQWKMQFNPDPNKQANEVFSSRKPNTDDYHCVKNVQIRSYF